MNKLERWAAGLAWKRMEAKMPQLKRWAPVLGSAALVAVVVLRLLGQTEAASAVEGLSNAVGLSSQSPVSLAEISAAIAAGVGVVLKIKGEAKKAIDGPKIVR